MAVGDYNEGRVEAADELLSVQDTYGMTVDKAEQVLSDQTASPEAIELADEVLADADTYEVDEVCAVQILADDEEDTFLDEEII